MTEDEKTSNSPENQSDNLENEKDEQQKQEPTYEEKVNAAAKELTRGEDGKYKTSEEWDEPFKVAVMAERRRRDTQSEYFNNTKELKAAKAKISVLEGVTAENTIATLTDEQQQELEELKYHDPDAWRLKMNKYEEEARTARKTKIDEALKVEVNKISVEEEEQQRAVILAQFQKDNPKLVKLTDDVIANDIPPRITNKLKSGGSFEVFLEEVKTYLTTGKVPQVEKAPKIPNMDSVGKVSKRTESQIESGVKESYAKQIF